jgi:hypothetical protein
VGDSVGRTEVIRTRWLAIGKVGDVCISRQGVFESEYPYWSCPFPTDRELSVGYKAGPCHGRTGLYDEGMEKGGVG